MELFPYRSQSTPCDYHPDGADKARQYLPYGSDQSQYPEDLWGWLNSTSRETGSEFIAIPHNSNVSKGYMFAEVTLKGETITPDYARTRMLWEPIVEVTQIKGDSETHGSLSPEDAFADFENFDFYLQQDEQDYTATAGDYVRSGLRRGLEIENRIGVNPYQFGLIGSTDSHTGLSSAEEDNFWGKFAHDSTPETKRALVLGGSNPTNGWNMSASGLAAVWATENTRRGIYDAFKRKEVYATTGPRIGLRVFAGRGFENGAETSRDFATIGYRQGVPMGADLLPTPDSSSPLELLIRAVKDPLSANLDRIQVVKGWLDDMGNSHEHVFNVAWAGDRQLDSDGKLAAIGDDINRHTYKSALTLGEPALAVRWQDPSFEPKQQAFYYVRVLQVPTARHSTLDALALGEEFPKDGPELIQERAYSSPIWYAP